MKCDCCGKKKKMLESFAIVETENNSLNLCVECNDLAYKVRDAANEGKRDDFSKYTEQWSKREKKPSEEFLNWKKDFIKKNEKNWICRGINK